MFPRVYRKKTYAVVVTALFSDDRLAILNMATDLENDGEAGGLGASLESFKEVEEVTDIIQDLENTIKDRQKHEVAVERFRLVLDWYQEQPHLLDPHLECLLELLVVQIRREEATAPLLHATATLAAHIFKVRGPKVVVKYLPHEVADLERVIAVLQVRAVHLQH